MTDSSLFFPITSTSGSMFSIVCFAAAAGGAHAASRDPGECQKEHCGQKDGVSLNSCCLIQVLEPVSPKESSAGCIQGKSTNRASAGKVLEFGIFQDPG
jgi:hypothetical protein